LLKFESENAIGQNRIDDCRCQDYSINELVEKDQRKTGEAITMKG